MAVLKIIKYLIYAPLLSNIFQVHKLDIPEQHTEMYRQWSLVVEHTCIGKHTCAKDDGTMHTS